MLMAAAGLSLDEWRLREGLTHKQLGGLIGCTGHMAYVYCCAPSEPAFRLPRADRMARIFMITNGEVGPASFFKLPKLTRPFDPKAPQLDLDTAEPRQVAA